MAGGGIVGAAVVERLSREGHRVTWCTEPGALRGATAASGAMLGVVGEIEPSEDAEDLKLRIDAAALHAHWRDLLRLTTAGAGTFVVGSARRPRERETIRAMEVLSRRHGLQCERVAPTDVPGLAPTRSWAPADVLFLADEAWVDPSELVGELRRTAGQTGRVMCVEEPAAAVEHARGRVTGLRTASGRLIEVGEVVVCTGADVASLIAASGLDAALVPTVVRAKGVGIVLARPEGAAGVQHVLRTPNRAFACGLHVVPRGDACVYVGATNRVSRLPDVLGGATAGEVSLLLGQVLRELAAPLASWDIAGIVSGTRPLAVAGRPIAGRTAFAGLSVATATYRNGVLLAPLLAELVAAELARPTGEAGALNRLSPQGAPADSDPAEVLRRGFGDLADQLMDPDDLWGEILEPLLSALATTAFAGGDDADRLREHVFDLIARHPRIEMVPEAVLELLSEAARGRPAERWATRDP